MQIEAIACYQQNCRIGIYSIDLTIMGLQNNIATLIDKLKDLAPL